MQELHRSQWNYILYQDNDEYLLSAMCGTVGLFEINIYLTEEEKNSYKKNGENYIEELAKKIRNAPSKFKERHVELSAD